MKVSLKPAWMYALGDSLGIDRASRRWAKSMALPENEWSPWTTKLCAMLGYSTVRCGQSGYYGNLPSVGMGRAYADTAFCGLPSQLGRAPRNVMMLPTWFGIESVVGAKANTTISEAQVKANFTKLVEQTLADGRNVVSLFVHDFKTNPSGAGYNEGLDQEELDWMLDIVDAKGGCYMTATEYGDWIRGNATAIDTPASAHRDSFPFFKYEAASRVWYKPDGIDNRWIRGVRAPGSAAAFDVTEPAASADLSATAGDGYVYLYWTPSVSADARSYRVYRFFDGATDTTLIGTATQPYFMSTSVVNGSPHNYFVTTLDAAGNESADSPHIAAYPGKILPSITRPAYYALWFQDPGSSITSAQLDSLAAFDAVVLGPFAMEGSVEEPAYATMLADLRSRNSDIIVLQYAHPWMVRTDGQGNDRSPYIRMKAYADTGADSSGYALNADGQIVRRSDVANMRLINFMRTGCADSVAFIWAEAYEKNSSMSGEYTGLFIDDVAPDPDYPVYPNVLSGTPSSAIDVIDADQNADVYSAGSEEPAAFRAYQFAFLKALRREFAQRGLQNRLIVANNWFGETGTTTTTESILALVDGAMVEGANRWFPGNAAADTTWDRAFGLRDLMTHTQVAPPMQMFQVHTDSSIAYQAEVLALANDSWVGVNDFRNKYGLSHIPVMPRRLPAPGIYSSYDISTGGSDPDTLSVRWANYTAKMILERNSSAPTDTFAVWPYVIFNPTTHDTLSISKYWEKAPDVGTPPALQIAVSGGDNYNDVAWGGVTYAGDIDHFNIRRSTDSSSPTDLFKVQAANVNKDLSGNWSWRDSTAVNDSTEYCYSVASVDVAGNEGPHVDYECATPSDVWPPSAPSGFTAVGGPGCNVLNWGTSGAPDFASYKVYRRQEGVAFSLIATRTNQMNSFLNDSTAVQSAIYRYTVAQVDDDANQSALSDTLESSWSGPPQPGVPTNLTVNANTPAQEQARLTWAAPSSLTNFVRYRIYKTAGLSRVFFYTDLIDSTTSPTWDDTDAPYDEGYTYCVKALYSPGGLSARSNFAFNSNEDTYPPTSPTLQIAAGNGIDGIDLNWSDVTGAAMYYVWRGIGSASTKIDSTATSVYTDTGAAENTTYTYGIKARDGALNMSALSNTMTASWTATPATGPSVSTVTGTFAHGNTITVAGSNFGARTGYGGAAVETIFDGMESGAISSGWSDNDGSPAGMIAYNNSASYRRHANSTAQAVTNFNGAVDGNYMSYGSLRWNPTTLSDKYFCQYWIYLDSDFEWGASRNLANIKIFRLLSGSRSYVIAFNLFGGSNAINYAAENIDSDMDYGGFSQVRTLMTTGAWHCLQFEAVESQPNVADGSLKFWIDGTLIKHATLMTRNDTARKYLQYLGWFDSFADPGYNDNHVYWDDFYASTSIARVEIGNNSNYDSCTHRETQVPTSWTSTSTTFPANTGSFTNGGAYLFVVDAEGNVSAGKAITISN
jgi:fibronectin type 3 domain-containing protein